MFTSPVSLLAPTGPSPVDTIVTYNIGPKCVTYNMGPICVSIKCTSRRAAKMFTYMQEWCHSLIKYSRTNWGTFAPSPARNIQPTNATLTLTAQIKIFLVSLWFIASKFRAVNLHTCTKSGAYWLRPKAVNTAEGVRFNSYCDNISTLPRCQNVTNPFFPSKLLK